MNLFQRMLTVHNSYTILNHYEKKAYKMEKSLITLL